MRTGFATGYDPGLSVEQMAEGIRQAEARGYELGFFSETIALLRDAVSAVAVFAHLTQRIQLGFTQIVRLRSPVIMAQTLASLDELSNGRVILALGACTNSHAARHSLVPLDPALTLKEWMEAIRLLLSGERVRYSGESLHLEDVGLGWRPVRDKIPIWTAATSRLGLQLAGELADGVVLNSVASPEYSRNAVRILRQAVEGAGKDWSEFQVAQIISCSVEDDRQKAYDMIRWEVASKFDPVQIPFNARPRMRVGEPYIREADLPLFESAYRKAGKPGLMQALPESYIQGLTASGLPGDVVARVQMYRDAGVTLPIVRPAASHQMRRLLDLFASR